MIIVYTNWGELAGPTEMDSGPSPVAPHLILIFPIWRKRNEPVIVPIQVYAVLGHLASGLVILAACEAAFDGKWLIDREWTPGTISLCGVTAYVLGRLVAVLSRLVIERSFVPVVLGAPEDILLAREQRSTRTWATALFPNYFQSLAKDTRDQIFAQAANDGLQASPPGILAHARSLVDEERTAPNRFGTLAQMSGICRTMCLGLLIVAAILVTGIFWHSLASRWSQAEWRKLGYFALSLVEAAGMLYRHLKFLRQHALEMLVGYVAIGLPESGQPEISQTDGDGMAGAGPTEDPAAPV
jgi:hypothetical protein